MEPKLTKLLHSQGCDSVEELETKIKKVLDSDNLAKWKEMTERFSAVRFSCSSPYPAMGSDNTGWTKAFSWTRSYTSFLGY